MTTPLCSILQSLRSPHVASTIRPSTSTDALPVDSGNARDSLGMCGAWHVQCGAVGVAACATDAPCGRAGAVPPTTDGARLLCRVSTPARVREPRCIKVDFKSSPLLRKKDVSQGFCDYV
eukprot:m.425244 g.425244  ORF g.425244 m.425244 type:complete len:120 (-) comp21344_c0_seq1:292-651(-)